jgi:GT2 family glycosyltransferase
MKRVLRWLLRQPWVLKRVHQLRVAATGQSGSGSAVHDGAHGTGRALWSFDEVLDIPGLGYWLRGWLLDPAHELRALRVRDESGGAGWDLLGQAQRYPRPDVAERYPGAVAATAGFLALARVEHVRPSQLVLEAEFHNGHTVVQALPPTQTPDAMGGTQLILAPFSTRHPQLRALLEQHVGPAVDALWSRRKPLPPAPSVVDFGRPPPNPRASVLIPLYGRYDFLRYQLALFANDASLRDVELIYVVDDPRILAETLALARGLAPVFNTAFRVVHCGMNLGFAGANNLGARVATGEYLVLLNSDVMPKSSGWLDALIQVLRSETQAGVVGPVLLYEDGSVQHAGMALEPFPEWAGYRINVHPGKGLPFTEAEAPPRSVPAITGACMVLRRALYNELGGLDEGYVLGDFEDSDLCHRIRRRGLDVKLVPAVQLYHLERQSQALFDDQGWKAKVSLYNCWRHERSLTGAGA